MSSATLPDVCGPSLSSADHLCDDCSNMGHEIRQLCEIKDFTIPKSPASVERNRSTCAFCGMIASSLRLGSGESEQNIIIHSNRHPQASSRPTDGVNGLMVSFAPRDHQSVIFYTARMALATTEGQNLFLLFSDRVRCLGLIVDTGSVPFHRQICFRQTHQGRFES
jgi:hypothetical protein